MSRWYCSSFRRTSESWVAVELNDAPLRVVILESELVLGDIRLDEVFRELDDVVLTRLS